MKPRPSPEREWTDVRVARRRHVLTDLAAPAAATHLVVVHLGRSQDVIGEIHGGLRLTEFSRAGLKIVPAGRSSEWHWRPRRPPSDSLHVHVHPDVFARAALAADVDPATVELIEYFGELAPEIERIGTALQQELGVGGAAEGLYVESLVDALAVLLLRSHSSLGAAARDRRVERTGGLSAAALRSATEYVEAHLHRGDVSVADIAGATGYTAHHFARLFRATTGISPHRYVIRRRVDRARALLDATDRSLSEVALSCGFTHQAHMTRHFRSVVGQTPGRYRLG